MPSLALFYTQSEWDWGRGRDLIPNTLPSSHSAILPFTNVVLLNGR